MELRPAVTRVVEEVYSFRMDIPLALKKLSVKAIFRCVFANGMCCLFMLIMIYDHLVLDQSFLTSIVPFLD